VPAYKNGKNHILNEFKIKEKFGMSPLGESPF